MRALVLAILLVCAAAGCGSEGGPATGGPVADGRHFGYVRAVGASATPATLDIDIAEFLSGEEANAAAEEDGMIAEGEGVPNDYYIRNEDEGVVTLEVAADVSVTHIQCPDSCAEGIPGQFDAFAASFDDIGEKTLNDEYRGAESQYWITVDGGQVVAIDEQYLP